VNAGDRLLVWAAYANQFGGDPTVLSTPSGFTLIEGASVDDNDAYYLWEKVATGAEGGTTFDIPFSGGTSRNTQVYVIRVSGSDGIDVYDIDTPGDFDTDADTPSITPNFANELVISIFTEGGATGTFAGTEPAGTTLAPGESTGSSNFGSQCGIAEYDHPTATATGVKTWTSTIGGALQELCQIAMLSSSAGGPVRAPMTVPRTRWID
jgi:hypothetical protein